MSPALQSRFLPTGLPGKPSKWIFKINWPVPLPPSPKTQNKCCWYLYCDHIKYTDWPDFFLTVFLFNIIFFSSFTLYNNPTEGSVIMAILLLLPFYRSQNCVVCSGSHRPVGVGAATTRSTRKRGEGGRHLLFASCYLGAVCLQSKLWLLCLAHLMFHCFPCCGCSPAKVGF